MKKKTRKLISNIILIILTIVIIVSNIIIYNAIKEIQPKNNSEYLVDTVFKHINVGNLYDAAINFTKQKEGFCKVPTISCDGSLTIGYGHVIKKNESFSSVTENQATILLKTDLQKAIDFVEDKTKLSGNKSLALGLLAFNIGTGRFLKYLKEDSLLTNIHKIRNYCHYHKVKNGQYITIKSKALSDRREFEIFIYNTYDL